MKDSLQKYNKMWATIPGATVGVMLADQIAQPIAEALSQLGLPVTTELVYIVVVIVICGASVWVMPKNKES